MQPADYRPLLRGHWYDALAAVLTAGGVQGPARSLATAAKRVLDLDAEDFAALGTEFADQPWAARLTKCCFPQQPRSGERGALESLIPLYQLMLEVLDLRAARHEPLQVVVTAHLIGEYLPQLAWESTLGHAGDPLRVATDLGERWGSADRACPHTSAQRATARRSVNAAKGDAAGFTAYLDRFHSRQGSALAVCAMNHTTVAAGQRPDVGETCPNPCGWAIRGTLDERRDLDARVRLALIYQGSALVALRHHAPVGHFFGVPSSHEIEEAWAATWARLTSPWPDGSNPLTEARGSSSTEALPGMGALVSAVAGSTVAAGRLIRDIGVGIEAALGVAQAVE